MNGPVLVLSGPALPMLGVAVVILLLGCVGVARERISPVTLSFFLLATCAAWWLAGASVMMMSAQHDLALAMARTLYVGVCLLPAAVLQFAFALTDELQRRRGLLLLTWSVSAAFLALFTMTNIFIVDVYQYRWGYYAKLSPAASAFLAWLGIVLAGSVLVLRGAIVRRLTDQQQRRAASFLAALAIGYLGATDFLPSFGIDLVPVGYLAILGFVVLSIRTILRYRFVDLGPSFVAHHLIDTVQGGVIVVDMHGVVRVANPAAAALLGHRGTLNGESLPALLDVPALPMRDSQTFARVGRTRNRSMTWKRRDGGKVEVSVSATLLRDQEQLPVGILYVIHDLTERRRAERHEFAANHDPLTALPNRAYLANRFEQALSDITAQGRAAAVLFVDLDGFKYVNDDHGHPTGDRLLQLVAARLRNALRDDDLIARYGGDEFVVLLSLRRDDDARIVASKLQRVMREPFAVEQHSLRVGASIGVAVAPRDGKHIDELVRAADGAMYRVKREKASARPKTTDRVAPSPFGAESRA